MTGPARLPDSATKTSAAPASTERGWLLFVAAILVATTLNSLLEQRGAPAVLLTMAAVSLVFLVGRRSEAVVALLFVFLAGAVVYCAAHLFGLFSEQSPAAFGSAAAGAGGAAVLLAIHFFGRRGELEAVTAPQRGGSPARHQTTAYDLMLHTVTRIPAYVRRFRPAGTAR